MRRSVSLSLSFKGFYSVPVLTLYHIHGLPEIEIEIVGLEFGSGEEEQRWIEDEAGGERIVPWKLGGRILSRRKWTVSGTDLLNLISRAAYICVFCSILV